MSTQVINNVMTSAVQKDEDHRTQYYTGGFPDQEAQMDYMQSLMPDSFKVTNEAKRLLQLACYWLQGRSDLIFLFHVID